MDSHLHPVVVQGEKISKLFSDNTYKKDWLEEKEWIYFPYHITPGYDQTKLNEKNISDKQYKQKVSYEHKFDLTQTDTYAKDKTIANSLLPAKYSAKAKASMNEFKPLPVTAEMIKSKEINDVLSNSVYTLAARQIKEKYNLDAHDYHLKHNMEVTANFSDIKYKEAFEKQIKGLFPTDTKIAYPEYEWKKQVNENQSDALYRKDADAKMHSFTIQSTPP